MAKNSFIEKWSYIPVTEIAKDLVLWAFLLLCVAISSAYTYFLPDASTGAILELAVSLLAVFFGVAIAAFGLVFGILTGEILRSQAAASLERDDQVGRFVGKLWFILTSDCAALFLVFLAVGLHSLGYCRTAVWMVSFLSLLVIGSAFNLVNATFWLFVEIRKRRNAQSH